MPDGFFKGELYGRTGLVPSNFVQLILDQEGSMGDTGEDVSAAGSFPQKFVALYDYDPLTQSPNDNPETELAFCEGDLIDITGPIDEVGSCTELSLNFPALSVPSTSENRHLLSVCPHERTETVFFCFYKFSCFTTRFT